MEGKVEYAFPDEFDSYDMNRDGQIEYEEFAFTLMRIFPMQQPEEFRGPFQDADLNGKQLSKVIIRNSSASLIPGIG